MQTHHSFGTDLIRGATRVIFVRSQPEQPPDPPEAYMPGTYTRTPQAESEKQGHSERPFIPNPDHYFNTRDILRQVEREKELERARKESEEQSPPPPERS